jgi:dienelactone hydrolase
MKVPRLLILCLLFHAGVVCVNSQTVRGPRSVLVRSGSLQLRALVWRPKGRGRFPAILFCPGSGQNPSPVTLGPVFAKHGYVFLELFRRGQGLSASQGPESSSLVQRERAANGDDAANRLQLRLLETDELDAELSGLAFLRSLPGVDLKRIAVVGHSFGGSLALLLAERDHSLRAVVDFAGAAASWPRSTYLRERLISAANKLTAPVFFIHAANDYSTTPGEVLDSELARLGKTHRLKVFPAFGQTVNEGHNFIFFSVRTWERDVFAFLDEHTARLDLSN